MMMTVRRTTWKKLRVIHGRRWFVILSLDFMDLSRVNPSQGQWVLCPSSVELFQIQLVHRWVRLKFGGTMSFQRPKGPEPTGNAGFRGLVSRLQGLKSLTTFPSVVEKTYRHDIVANSVLHLKTDSCPSFPNYPVMS